MLSHALLCPSLSSLFSCVSSLIPRHWHNQFNSLCSPDLWVCRQRAAPSQSPLGHVASLQLPLTPSWICKLEQGLHTHPLPGILRLVDLSLHGGLISCSSGSPCPLSLQWEQGEVDVSYGFRLCLNFIHTLMRKVLVFTLSWLHRHQIYLLSVCSAVGSVAAGWTGIPWHSFTTDDW